MTINKLASPAESLAASASNQQGVNQMGANQPEANQLEAGRRRLHSALTRSGGKTFTYQESLFPAGTKSILLVELATIGCEVELRVDSRVGNYYEISPR